MTYSQSTLTDVIPPELRQYLLYRFDDILLRKKTTVGDWRLFIVWLDASEMPTLGYTQQMYFVRRIYLKLWPHCVERRRMFRPETTQWHNQDGPPVLCGHLQQFVCAINGLHVSIPNFTKITRPVQHFLEWADIFCANRSKLSIAWFRQSEVEWSLAEPNAFGACKQALAHQVTLSHRDETKRLCV